VYSKTHLSNWADLVDSKNRMARGAAKYKRADERLGSKHWLVKKKKKTVSAVTPTVSRRLFEVVFLPGGFLALQPMLDFFLRFATYTILPNSRGRHGT